MILRPPSRRVLLAVSLGAALAAVSARAVRADDEVDRYLRTGAPETALQKAAAAGALKPMAQQPLFELTDREVLMILQSAREKRPDQPIWTADNLSPALRERADADFPGQADRYARTAAAVNQRNARVILRIRLGVFKTSVDEAYEALRGLNPLHYVVEKLFAAAQGREPVMGTPIARKDALMQVVSYLVLLKGTNWAMKEIGALRAETRALRFPPLRPEFPPNAATPLLPGEAITDSNVIIALKNLERYEATSSELVRRDFLLAKNLTPRYTPTSSLLEGGGPRSNPVSMTVAPNSPEYLSMVEALKAGKVGMKAKTGGGGIDRKILADSFFAQTADGKTPIFLTADEGIYKKLLMCRENDPIKDLRVLSGKVTTLPAYKNGFEVVIHGRHLWVIPVPGK